MCRQVTLSPSWLGSLSWTASRPGDASILWELRLRTDIEVWFRVLEGWGDGGRYLLLRGSGEREGEEESRCLSLDVCDSSSMGLSRSESTSSSSSSSVSSNWNLSPPPPKWARPPVPTAPSDGLPSLWCSSGLVGEGLRGIMLWYHSRLSSRVSRISWASGWTRSAHVSHSGCTT